MRIEHRRRASHSYAISLRLAETFMGMADGRDSRLPSKVPWVWNVHHVAKWREREREREKRATENCSRMGARLLFKLVCVNVSSY